MALRISTSNWTHRQLVKPFRLLGMAAMLCMLALPAVAANKVAKVKKESRRAGTKVIESMEASWRDAMLNADPTSLEKLLAEDFLGISANGTLSDKTQYLHRIGMRISSFQQIDLMDLKLRMQPTSAVAVSQARVIGVLDGHPINGVFRYTRVYGKNPSGQWRVMNYEATRVSGAIADDTDMHRGTPLAPRRNEP